MRSALAFRPRSLPLQLASPGPAVFYLGSLVAVAFLYSNPLVLTAVVMAGTLAGLVSRAGAAVRLALKLGLALALLMIVVNGLITSQGQTVVARLGDWPLLGQVDVTAEALAAGAVIGLRVMAVTVVLAVYSACVNPDRVLRTLRPIAGRSALTAGLVSRMVPVAIADASRINQAAKLRGPAAAPAGRAQLARRLLAGSLDRAVDVAATLELRGYSLPTAPRSRAGDRDRSLHDRRFWLGGVTVLALAIGGLLAGAARFSAYSTLAIETAPATLALAGAIALTGLVPWRR